MTLKVLLSLTPSAIVYEAVTVISPALTAVKVLVALSKVAASPFIVKVTSFAVPFTVTIYSYVAVWA